MKLYQTPGGTWCGTEASWKAAMKAEGHDHKTASRKMIEVPTSKPELMEFLTYYNVNCVAPLSPVADSTSVPVPAAPSPAAPATPTAPGAASDWKAQFRAASFQVKAELMVEAIDAAEVRLAGKP